MASPRTESGQIDPALLRLLQECKQQLQTFKRGIQKEDSFSCTEILQRSAAGSRAALVILLEEITKGLVEEHCRNQFLDETEFIVEKVLTRLTKKFLSRTKRYQVSDFAGYRKYVNLTIRSVISNQRRSGGKAISLDEYTETTQKEPSASSNDFELVERRADWQEVLKLVPDPLEREALDRRIGLLESPQEIAEAMSNAAQKLTKRQVFRLVERAKRRLVKSPRFRELWEPSL
jgi:hypothetical protein